MSGYWRRVVLAESEPALEPEPDSTGDSRPFDLSRYFTMHYDFVTDSLRVSRSVSESEFRQICEEAASNGTWEDAVTLSVVANLLGYIDTLQAVYTPDVVARLAQREGDNPVVAQYLLGGQQEQVSDEGV